MGLSAVIWLGVSTRDDACLLSIASCVTRLYVHVPSESVMPDGECLRTIDALARAPAALVLCGDLDRYRQIGATQLRSLNARPHVFRHTVW